jgi:hypothetical protein
MGLVFEVDVAFWDVDRVLRITANGAPYML